MGRRNTQLRTEFVENKSQKRWLGQRSRNVALVGFDGNSQTDRFFKGSIGGSTDWMVLHRPVELARITGQVPHWNFTCPVCALNQHLVSEASMRQSRSAAGN